MNRKQRMKNRSTARWLSLNQPCSRCNTPGAHFIVTEPLTLQGLLDGKTESGGFWTCPDLYGPDGRRIAA